MRSAFVLWSAGVDSTYLILRLLEDGYSVKAGYIDIKNNHVKARMEKHAIDKMCLQIEALFPDFEYVGTIYKAHNSSPERSSLRYKQVPYFIHALLIAPRTDYRCVGYVKGDSAIKSLTAIKNIYDQYSSIYNGALPELVFPLRNATKQEIFTYMQECYPNILSNCVWCESPQGDDFIPCDTCTPCIRRKCELASMQPTLQQSA